MCNPNFIFHFHDGQPNTYILEQDGGGLATINIANKSKIIVKVGYLRRSDGILPFAVDLPRFLNVQSLVDLWLNLP